MNKSFSIIMPAYNVEKYIGNAIKSVLTQTYQNFELIVVDDGSTDKTSEIISTFADSRIIVIKQENQGLGRARNVGINNAKNEYVAFLDSDDLWAPQKLENVLNELALESIGIFYSNALIFVDNISKAVKNRYSEPIFLKDFRELILVYDFIIVSSVVIPRNILLEFNGFSEDLYGTEDWDLWIRITRKYGIKKIDEYDTFYRINPNGLSKKRLEFLQKEYKVIERHLIGNKAVNSKLINLALWVWYKKNFYYYLGCYNLKLALNFFVKMIKTNPFSFSNFDFLIRVVKKIFSNKLN